MLCKEAAVTTHPSSRNNPLPPIFHCPLLPPWLHPPHQAAQLFQETAGLYALLKEAEASKVDAPRPADLTPECCTMLERLMLAQAQVRGGWVRVCAGVYTGCAV